MVVEKGEVNLFLNYLCTRNACTWEADSRRADHEIPCFMHTMHTISLSNTEGLSSEPDRKWMCLNCNLINHRLASNFSLGGVVDPEAIYIYIYICIYIYTYTGCPRRNVPDFGRVFLMLKYTDITQNTYVQSWTVTEIMARENCGLLAGSRTVPVSWQVLSMFVLEFGVRFSSH